MTQRPTVAASLFENLKNFWYNNIKDKERLSLIIE